MPKPNSELMKSLEQATAKYEVNLDLAADYLESRRIATSTARSLRLGYVVEPEPGHDWFVGRLAIPYITRAGVVQIKFRSIDGAEPKYLGIEGIDPHLYNVEDLFVRSTYIAITEGELDTAVLSRQVGIPAVGCPGVHAWLDHFPRLFAGYDRVLHFADGDTAGREFAKRIATDLDNLTTIAMPDGMDVNDVYVLEGADALRKRAGL